MENIGVFKNVPIALLAHIFADQDHVISSLHWCAEQAVVTFDWIGGFQGFLVSCILGYISHHTCICIMLRSEIRTAVTMYSTDFRVEDGGDKFL